MKRGHTDRSHYPVTRQFSPAKLCQCAREHRSLPRFGRLQRACCTRCILVRERAVSVMNAILLRMDARRDCALHRSTRSLVAIFQRRVSAASTSRALRPRWLDIILRTEDTTGKSEMKKGLRGINPASKPSGDGCVECLASPKGWWFYLRRCAECGHIGCCDSSASTHASKHAAATGHPIIASL